jgi:hypothetical protein
MNRTDEAKELFNSITIDKKCFDTYWLHKSLFELYKDNGGLAKEHLDKALSEIDSQLPNMTQDDWWRFGAVATKLGYGKWLLAHLEKGGFDTSLAPYFVAVNALNEKDPEGYLNSKAVEIREPARIIVGYMQKYIY